MEKALSRGGLRNAERVFPFSLGAIFVLLYRFLFSGMLQVACIAFLEVHSRLESTNAKTTLHVTSVAVICPMRRSQTLPLI